VCIFLIKVICFGVNLKQQWNKILSSKQIKVGGAWLFRRRLMAKTKANKDFDVHEPLSGKIFTSGAAGPRMPEKHDCKRNIALGAQTTNEITYA